MSDVPLRLVPVELVTQPEPAEIKERLFQLWSWQAAYSLARALRLLGKELSDAGYDEDLVPNRDTAQSWIVREHWRDRAQEELRREYATRDRRVKEDRWKLELLLTDRAIDSVTGGAPMTKDEVSLFKLILQTRGAGSFGAIMGGELSLSFPATESEKKALTTQQRSREQRQRTIEENRGTA